MFASYKKTKDISVMHEDSVELLLQYHNLNPDKEESSNCLEVKKIPSFPKDNYVSGRVLDLSNIYAHPSKEFLRNYGNIPIITDISEDFIKEVYSLFDSCINNFEDLCIILKEWELDFAKTEASAPLGRVRFGIRDKRPVAAIKDKKYYFQFGKEYYDWVISERKEQLESNPDLYALFLKLHEIDIVVQDIFIKQINLLISEFPESKNLFYSYQGEQRIPVSIRLICYEESGEFNTRPHYDKAAFGLIFPSDDDPKAECLLVSPANGEPFELDSLQQVVRTDVDTSKKSCALLIAGALLEHLGIPIPPTAHLVLPHQRELRHVLVAFCNVPYLDSEVAIKDYNITTKDNIDRKFIHKFRLA